LHTDDIATPAHCTLMILPLQHIAPSKAHFLNWNVKHLQHFCACFRNIYNRISSFFVIASVFGFHESLSSTPARRLCSSV